MSGSAIGSFVISISAVGGGASPLGYEQIGGLDVARGLTVPPGATVAIICPEGFAVRYRDSGKDPTPAYGMPLAVGQVLAYAGPLDGLRFIEQGASAILNVLYYGSAP